MTNLCEAFHDDPTKNPINPEKELDPKGVFYKVLSENCGTVNKPGNLTKAEFVKKVTAEKNKKKSDSPKSEKKEKMETETLKMPPKLTKINPISVDKSPVTPKTFKTSIENKKPVSPTVILPSIRFNTSNVSTKLSTELPKTPTEKVVAPSTRSIIETEKKLETKSKKSPTAQSVPSKKNVTFKKVEKSEPKSNLKNIFSESEEELTEEELTEEDISEEESKKSKDTKKVNILILIKNKQYIKYVINTYVKTGEMGLTKLKLKDLGKKMKVIIENSADVYKLTEEDNVKLLSGLLNNYGGLIIDENDKHEGTIYRTLTKLLKIAEISEEILGDDIDKYVNQLYIIELITKK